jgi:hypothetical protein
MDSCLVENQNVQRVYRYSKLKKLSAEVEAIDKKLQNPRISEKKKLRLLRHRKNISEKAMPRMLAKTY